MNNRVRLLVVDDELIALKNLEYILKKEGYEVVGTQSGVKALKLLEEEEFPVVLTDLRMEKVNGMQILERCRQLYPYSEVIIITAYATIDSAVEAMKKGAYHYIAKPYKFDEVRKVVAEAVEKNRLQKEVKKLKERLKNYEKSQVIIVTEDENMRKLLQMARKVAPTDCNILISGETGTGKELLARYIHDHSLRAKGPMLAINCGAFHEELLANELFGHEKGAFTGANYLKKGLIEMASQGTLFLDEITDMSHAMQTKLMRVIQEKEIMRLGGTSPIKVDVRFIAATNQDIQEAVKNGRFREDLYYRLNVVSLHIPPLCERKGDIPLLSYYFLKKYADSMNKDIKKISSEVIEILTNYDYPGNIRELENIIERGVALCLGDVLQPEHLPEDLRRLEIRTFRKRGERYPTLKEQEKSYILWVLKKFSGNKTRAAEVLGIDRVSLWRKLKRYGIEK
ncbi:Fis family transcriptional regulator [Candidatus Desulfofervidus auxilii]|uniref:Fis family transcriptional regulator n=2 Tax=Desulfofervidus auxilii TaxID=1621989 RepID=A0A7U4QLP4_DESA2|nr:sigma-54 dependent transcriptional regulator [Candidatus Desulfofervidus auxilii]AMM41652.1 Fis family transcriptional regulator [Candidatus Desulfofervidus auxilii]CAD7780729.1 MAG: Regulatory protein AtoC [Candidatus Methanoperedenaceae archaeon GB50]